MRIVIDIQGMQTHQSRDRGVGRYICETVKEFIKISHNHDVILVANDNYGDTEESLQNKLGKVKIAFWSYRAGIKTQDLQRNREKFILNLRPDIVYMLSLQEGFGENTVTSVNKTVDSSCIWVTNLPDVIPLIFKEDYLVDPTATSWYNEKLSQTLKSDYIVTVSEFSRARISELLPFDKSKIFVMTPAVDRDIFNLEKTIPQADVTPYILFVSGYNPHKNIERLIQAYSRLPKDIRSTYKLLLIGKHLDHYLRPYLVDNNIQNVEILENVSDNDLINYYKNSSLFVFPSYAEGFGIPPLEAMACGVPTITSNAHSLPEVSGMYASMFNPFDTSQISNMMHRALTDHRYRKALIDNGLKRAKHYTWRKSAEYMLQCFEEINNNHQRGKK